MGKLRKPRTIGGFLSLPGGGGDCFIVEIVAIIVAILTIKLTTTQLILMSVSRCKPQVF